MNKYRNLTLIMSLLAMTAMAQKTINVTVTNNGKTDRENEPVVVSLNNCGMDVKSALVTENGTETPCQLDDIDRDGRFDELCFMTGVPGHKSRRYTVTLSDNGKPRHYEPRVYAELMLLDRRVKEKNKQILYISELTVNRGVNPYGAVNHHGAAFENELLAMRIYFDHRQTVDLYGKNRKGLELKDTQFYPSKEQKKAGYGDDILWVGTSYGLGALRGWNGTASTMLTDVDYRSQRIIASGPLRTIVEVEDRGWTPQPRQQPVDMKIHYTLYAGRRDCSVSVSFNRNVADLRFATGLVNVLGSTEYTDHRGLRGCWGTAWPVALKDSAGHKPETVGLGICIPERYIDKEMPATPDDYTHLIRTDGNSLEYRITYSSDNENYGYHSAKDWFCFLREWKKELAQPLEIKISE